LFYSKAAKHVTEELKVSKLIKVFSNDIPLIVDNYIPSLISLNILVCHLALVRFLFSL
jgi:proteasome assembly chaperone (PAC2) family protein